ncbi:MAG: phage terminase small subunit P27 family [Anaerolineaceae bacterium]|jgi:P27 family predicted phage terminase small subunit
MKPGPKPTPTALKNLHGRSHHKQNKNEPRLPGLSTMPAAPKHLGEMGKEKWQEAGTTLIENHLLTELDLDALDRYCTYYETLKKAEHMITVSGGEILMSEKGGSYQNPWFSIYNQANNHMLKLGNELGLSLIARSRLEVSLDDLPDPEVAKFLGPKES